MQIEPKFLLRPLPEIPGQPEIRVRVAPGTADPTLGLLQDLPGIWKGDGLNVIWHPNSTPGHDLFLELNLTTEVLEFSDSIGDIPNRGLLQGDIVMNGITYMQKIADANLQAGLHVEPGIWAIVPETTNPREPNTIVRMATIPHGTSLLAQGIGREAASAPSIPDNNITPFDIGHPEKLHKFTETNLATPSEFRSPPSQTAGITQTMIDNPNSLLKKRLGQQKIERTVTLTVSTDPSSPILGGGTANTAFLQGTPLAGANTGPNALAIATDSTFWIEHVAGQNGGQPFLQLQYSQRVLLNFNGLSWPHVSVATLRKEPV